MAGEHDERPRPVSPYDYSDKSIQHAYIAVLAYLGLRALSALIGALRQPAIASWFVIDFLIAVIGLGLIAFGIYKKSRAAVVLAIVYIVGTQLYVWLVVGSFAGTVVSVIVTGFLLRGAKRIFESHGEQRGATTQAGGDVP